MKIKVDYFTMSPSRFIAGTLGSYGFENIELEFSDEWSGLGKKLVFYPKGKDPVSVVYSGEPVRIPYEVMSTRGVSKFAVVGYEGERTLITVSGQIDVLNTLEPEGSNTVEPTQSEMMQVLDIMAQTLEVSKELRASALAGEFDGRDGNKWYCGGL